MHLKWHLLASIPMGLALGSVPAAVVGGVLTDLVDHGIYFLATVRPLTAANLKKTHWEKYENSDPGFFFFHTIEAMILVAWLTKGFPWSGALMVSYLVHMLMDAGLYLKKGKGFGFLKWWSATYLVWEKVCYNRGK